MLKNVIRVFMVLAMLLASVFAETFIADVETNSPMAMRYEVTLEFNRSSMPRDDIARQVAAIATKHDTPIVLLKSGTDPLKDYDVFWFGVTPTRYVRADGSIDWYAPNRGGVLRSADRLGTATISGDYASDSKAAIGELQTLARQLGGSADQIYTLDARTFVKYLVISSPDLWAMGLLLLALAWAWSGSRSRSRNLRIMNGVSPWAAQIEDMTMLVRVALPWSAGAWLLTCVAAAVLHGPAHVPAFMMFSGIVAFGMVAAMIVGSLLFAMLMTPPARRVTTRRMPNAMIRRGGMVFTVLALTTAIIVLPTSAQAAVLAQQNLDSSARWRRAPNLVALQTTNAGYVGLASGNSNSADEYRRTRYDAMLAMLRQVDEAGALVLAANLTNNFYRGMTAPTREQRLESVAPYDQVLVVNRAYLRALHVPEDGLRAQRWDTIPSNLRDVLSLDFSSDSDWPNVQPGSGFDIAHACYTWRGTGMFPAVDNNSATLSKGVMADARNPLLIVADRPSSMFTAENFEAWLSWGAVMTTDAAAAQQAIASAGIADMITIRGRVADQILDQARRWQARLVLELVTAALAAAAIILCAALSANIWASERAHEIFLRRTAGESYGRIALARLVWQAASLIVVWLLAWQATNLLFPPDQTNDLPVDARMVLWLSLAAASALYLAGVAFFHIRAAGTAFTHVSHRQE